MTPETRSAVRVLSASIVEPEYERLRNAAMHERITALEARVEALAEENDLLGRAIVKLSHCVVWNIPRRFEDPSAPADAESSPTR